MMGHFVRCTALCILAVACMFYPFMPGPYDPLAVPLSGMVQTLGFGGLIVLTPLAVLWLLHDAITRRRSRSFAIVALVSVSLVGLGVVVAASVISGVLGMAVAIVWFAAVRRLVPRVRTMRTIDVPLPHRFNPATLYLVIIPAVLVGAQLAFFETAVESSRRRAIAGSMALINAIEEYRDLHGRYPLSLASVHDDYDSPVVGVGRYHYEPHGDAYNVFFEQFSHRLGTREFVVYNPRDEQTMIVHNQDVLESPPQAVERERRFHAAAARPAGVPHWKYFWFD